MDGSVGVTITGTRGNTHGFSFVSVFVAAQRQQKQKWNGSDQKGGWRERRREGGAGSYLHAGRSLWGSRRERQEGSQHAHVTVLQLVTQQLQDSTHTTVQQNSEDWDRLLLELDVKPTHTRETAQQQHHKHNNTSVQGYTTQSDDVATFWPGFSFTGFQQWNI